MRKREREREREREFSADTSLQRKECKQTSGIFNKKSRKERRKNDQNWVLG